MKLLITLFIFLLSLSIPAVYAQSPSLTHTSYPNPKALSSSTLGGMDLDGWCQHINQGKAILVNNIAWDCSGNNQPIDFTSNPTLNCVWQYNVPDAFAQQANTGDPYSWTCYTNHRSSPTQTPTPTSIQATPTLLPTTTPTPPSIGQFIAKLQLINTDTQTAILDSFTSGSNINIATTPHVNLNAITNPAKVGSVIFILDNRIHTENVAPYDDPGDTNGNFNPFTSQIVVGTHTLSVTPYALANGAGTKGSTFTITFTVTNAHVTPTATPTLTPTPNATDDWATYKFNAQRSSFNPQETIINANSAINLTQKLNLPCAVAPCSFKQSPAGAVISDSPAVVNNIMYYGDWTGNFYAKNVSDGTTIWSRNLGTMTPTAGNCNPPSVGVVSSPSIQNVNLNGVQTPIVFIAGADGNMYALRTTDGSILWQTKLADPSKGELLWDSPSEANGRVYVGIASEGDCPLVQGRIYKLDGNTGSIQAMTNLVPDGCVGAGSWGSPTYDQENNKLYVATGTQDNSCKVNGQPLLEPYALAVVELDGTTMNIVGSYRIPASEQGPDSDFGVSPALATTTINGVKTQVVEAANKNGHAYIFKRDALTDGPIVNLILAPGGGGTCPDCSMGTISSAATDGVTLYQGMGMCNAMVASNCATTGFNSIMFAIDPKDGTIKWQTLIPKQIVSTPILLNDILIVFEGNNISILRTSDGTLVSQIIPPGTNSILDGSGAIARGKLFFGNLNGNFYIYGL